MLYYIIVLPLSKLPLWLLYIIFYPIYLIIYHIIGYRKGVVYKNVRNAFPEKTPKDQAEIVTKFYRHLAKMIAESIKNISISQKELKRRVQVDNLELMTTLFNKNQNVILLSSHFNNWELLITAQNLIFEHKAIGIGMPLSNSFWDKKLNARRERFGMHVVNSKNYKTVLDSYKDEPTATLVLGDQSPSNVENIFWTTFLNQSTAFYFGAEIMANQMEAAVVFASVHELKKGHYNIKLDLITDDPKKTNYAEITSAYISKLEQDIKNQPERWLWSHKRWKIEVPEQLDSVKLQHKQRFEKKFRSNQFESTKI